MSNKQRYIPHTDDDVTRMLGVVGKPTVDSLFAHIPARLRATRPLDIAPLDEGSLVYMPTTIVLNSRGQVVDRLIGPQTAARLKAELHALGA